MFSLQFTLQNKLHERSDVHSYIFQTDFNTFEIIGLGLTLISNFSLMTALIWYSVLNSDSSEVLS